MAVGDDGRRLMAVTNKQSWMETQLEAEVDGATSALAQIGRLV
jgi:hypothetical protein